MRLALATAVFVAVTASRTANATPSARLVYARSASAASCPDEAALRKAVAARFGYDPFFGWAKQTVVVHIIRDAGLYAARVELVDDQGLARGTREIQSDEENCSDVFDAAALAISIALDASAITVSPSPTAEEAVVEPPSPSVALQLPQPTDDRVLHETEGAGTTPTSAFRIGVDALASALVSPNLALGVAAFGDFRKRALSLGIELQTDLSVPASETLGQITSALFVAALAPCLHYHAVFFCALGQAGWLQAWAWGSTHGSDGALFVGVGGRGGVEWQLSRRLFIRVHTDILANLNGANFQLATETVWSAKPVVGALGVGVGVPLP